MAEPTMITSTVTAVDVEKESFKIAEGNVWVSHTKLEWRKGLGPPLSVGLLITFEGFQSKGRWYANNISVVSQPHPSNAPAAASYAGMQQAAAVVGPVASTTAPTPAAVAEPPRNGPEPVPGDAGPVLGTHASTELSIQRQVALKTAVEYLVGVYAGAANEEKSAAELDGLIANALYLARGLADALRPETGGIAVPVAAVAMPDDTLVPTPSEAEPEYRGG